MMSPSNLDQQRSQGAVVSMSSESNDMPFGESTVDITDVEHQPDKSSQSNTALSRHVSERAVRTASSSRTMIKSKSRSVVQMTEKSQVSSSKTALDAARRASAPVVNTQPNASRSIISQTNSEIITETSEEEEDGEINLTQHSYFYNIDPARSNSQTDVDLEYDKRRSVDYSRSNQRFSRDSGNPDTQSVTSRDNQDISNTFFISLCSLYCFIFPSMLSFVAVAASAGSCILLHTGYKTEAHFVARWARWIAFLSLTIGAFYFFEKRYQQFFGNHDTPATTNTTVSSNGTDGNSMTKSNITMTPVAS
ncbi:hypothetical protein EGW08_004880 [Elysia chlorotica]|uniref:Uncharacterized protein n=1 Tax=Elysia chlorotica TaxID=188477 RepID=A0A3S1BMW5_ELYCH|nr:hypothetical protein EGW08_004880 [Elysia chlorotica]